MVMDKNKVKIELYKSKVNAKLSQIGRAHV